jgi:tetratricopeptide (TPR) repeat protein
MKATTRALLVTGFIALSVGILPRAEAQTPVGKLLAVEGAVKIDAFGKGAFIAALRGDLLYKDSVLRVPATGSATLEVGSRSVQAPPGATLVVSDLLAATERRAGLRWIDALGRLVSGIGRSAKGSEEEVTLGSRAADKSEDSDAVSWSVEEEPGDGLFRTGREKIAAGDLAGALKDLLAVENRSGDTYTTAELSFWRGQCYYELGDYRDAEVSFQASLRDTDADPLALDASLRRTLLLELGASRLYLGRPGDSVAPLRALVREKKADDRTLYGYLALVEALAAAGDRAAAASELRDADRIFAGSAGAKDLAELRAKLSF